MGYRLALIEVAEEVDRKIRDEGRSTLILPHDLRREIMAGYAEGNLALAQRYFGRDELFLEPLPSPGQEIVSPALPQDTEVLMSRLVGPFVQALINRFDQN